jgi:hypothetical protein
MTEHPQHSALDAHAHAFGDELRRASAQAGRRRRRARRLISISIPLAGAATLAIAFWPAGEQVSPLERAAAALEPSTGVIHFRVSSGPIGMRRPPCTEKPVDIWLEITGSADSDPRWRYRDNSARCLTRGIENGLGHIATGRQDVWFNGRDRAVYAIDDGWTETLTDMPETNPNRQLPDVTQLTGAGSEDPLKTLRRLYTGGKVRPTGVGAIAGRKVRFFEGPFDVTEANDTVRIAVDAESFVPVEVRVRMPETPETRQRGDDAAIGFWVRFSAYDVATERDLAPTIPTDTQRASMDYRAFRREVRKAGAYPPKPISAAERQRAAARLAERTRRP